MSGYYSDSMKPSGYSDIFPNSQGCQTVSVSEYVVCIKSPLRPGEAGAEAGSGHLHRGREGGPAARLAPHRRRHRDLHQERARGQSGGAGRPAEDGRPDPGGGRDRPEERGPRRGRRRHQAVGQCRHLRRAESPERRHGAVGRTTGSRVSTYIKTKTNEEESPESATMSESPIVY